MRPQTVIEGDGHICEPGLVWTDYTQERYRDLVLRLQVGFFESGLGWLKAQAVVLGNPRRFMGI